MFSEIQQRREGLDLLLAALGTAPQGEVRCILGKERRQDSVGMGMSTNSALVHKSNSCLAVEESFYFLRTESFQGMTHLMKTRTKTTVIHERNQGLLVFLLRAYLLWEGLGRLLMGYPLMADRTGPGTQGRASKHLVV